MFEEQREMRVFRVTVKKVIERLLEIQESPIGEFKDLIIEQFDGYDYEDEEELVGFELWEDISQNGKYQLPIKINHKDAYEFTLFIETKDKKVTIYNVL